MSHYPAYPTLGVRRSYAYALVSKAEHDRIKAKATAAGLSVSDYVRMCINSVWLEEGDDTELLATKKEGD